METRKFPKHQIFILDDAIDNDLCDIIINIINNSECEEENYGRRSNVISDMLVVEDTNEEIINESIKERIYSVFKRIIYFFNQFDEDLQILNCAPIQIRKIKGKTRPHSDGIIPNWDDDTVVNERISLDLIRKMSVIIALNDDYEGGELCFPEQEFKIKLKRGQAIAFPPYWTHPHHTTELLENTVRYTANTWFYGV